MHILVTGFEPFGGESTNPSMELIRALDAQIGAAHIPIPPFYLSPPQEAYRRRYGLSRKLGRTQWCAWVRRGAAAPSPWSG